MTIRRILLLGAALTLPAGSLPAQPVASPSSAVSPRAAASAPARLNPPAADLSGLAPRDAAPKPVDVRNSLDRHNSRGVNCSNYPARCR